MSLVMMRVYEILNDSAGISDPRTDRFLMRSPLQPIVVSLLYLIFVYKLGPRLMKKRQPFDLKGIIVAYNLFQIVSNTVLFCMFYRTSSHLNWSCSPSASPKSTNPTILIGIQAHYYYAILKYVDLIETIFFVLRKKDRQISYLHVHHHIGILAAAWISCKYFPGGQALYVGFYNTFVHAVMYCYYLLTSWNSYSNGIWWKKYITLMQIIQHYMVFARVVPAVVNVNCSYPKFWMGLFSVNVVLIIYLFTKFYRNNYLTKRASKGA